MTKAERLADLICSGFASADIVDDAAMELLRLQARVRKLDSALVIAGRALRKMQQECKCCGNPINCKFKDRA